METQQVRMINPTELAFVGDAVYELLVREHIARRYVMGPAALHAVGVEFVSARFQSRYLSALEGLLVDEESAMVRRGRNANRVSVPRHIEPRDYRRATGLEALFGYLHLSGQGPRIEELFARIVECHDELFPDTGRSDSAS